MSYDQKTVLSHIRRLTEDDLRIWVREGWVRPAQGESGPVFDDLDVARLRLLCDLCVDMSLPNDAMPVVLTLLDRLHESRRRLRHLSDVIAQQPEPTRHAIVERYRAVAFTAIDDHDED